MKKVILTVGSILLGLILFALLLSGENSLLGVSKKGMLKNIEYVNQVP